MIVGGGQITVSDGEAPDPVQLLAEALRSAVPTKVLARAEMIGVPRIVSRGYPDPAALLATEVGAAPRDTVYTPHGGQTPLALLHDAALRVQAGQVDVAIVGGAECGRTRHLLKRRGARPDWLEQGPVRPTRTVGTDFTLATPAESAIGFGMPVQAYPLFETALRARRGLSVTAHAESVADLWASFSRVAARNPHAALPGPYGPDEIRTVTSQNRIIGDPYTKLMVSNDRVDQAAGVVVCSVDAARSLGVPTDRWLFVHGIGRAEDTPTVSDRDDLSRSGAIAHAGAEALRSAGADVDDLALVDVYSCFPSAVEIAVEELGLGTDRPLTVTGGLSFAGGPWNNYTSHALVTMYRELLDRPAELGMITGNGGVLTKHAVAVVGGAPPAGRLPPGERFVPVHRPVDTGYDGPGVVEAYTVMRDRDGLPTTTFVACRTPSGSRVLAAATGPSEVVPAPGEDLCGALVQLRGTTLAGRGGAERTFRSVATPETLALLR